MYFPYETCTTKLRFSSWRCGSLLRVLGSVLRVLDLYYKVAIFELERCGSVLPVLDLYYKVAIFELERCGSVLPVLDLYYKVAIFELEMRKFTSRTRLVLQSCDFRSGAAEVYFVY